MKASKTDHKAKELAEVIKYSADFQIFSYRIRWPTRIRKCLAKGAELSNR